MMNVKFMKAVLSEVEALNETSEFVEGRDGCTYPAVDDDFCPHQCSSCMYYHSREDGVIEQYEKVSHEIEEKFHEIEDMIMDLYCKTDGVIVPVYPVER